ncbi:potassium transporter [Fulvitalea axinellae]|uniref:Potassium transporter n=1 Tax=Fulvitalea axinellae TaxID=1182444 RepID=A0AAU9CEZ2_9BACT|nr:potassium transporter [Fulvitalea axinellae]
MKLNYKIILHILGLLLMINGGFMLLCLPFAFAYDLEGQNSWIELLISGLITIAVGAGGFFPTRGHKSHLKKRDGYIIVTFGWLFMSLFATLPYLFSGAIPSFTNAFFETVSGYTTTGASILNNIEELPMGILTWRSMTQWIGGMGIIVLTVAIMPILGMGGIRLFSAESPGLSPDKLKPRIADTAKRLWIIYAGLTAMEVVLLMFGGMSFVEAFNHSLTTMATGGFSTKQDSIAFYDNAYLQYVLIVFMFLAGTNFSMTYMLFKGRFKKIWNNEEFRFYSLMTIVATLIVATVVLAVSGHGAERSFRDALFQVVSIVTTTGYVSADYTAWMPFVTLIFFVLMFIGASAGSTAGGVKVIRHIILFKNSLQEFKRQLHPQGVIPVRIDGKAISNETTFNVLAFMIVYIIIFAVGSILMSMTGVDFMTAIGAVATSLGNIGPGVGSVGPVDNFAHLPLAGKWLLSFLMLLGRLELFTVLVILSPAFWKDY